MNKLMIARWEEKIIREPFFESPLIQPLINKLSDQINSAAQAGLIIEELEQIQEIRDLIKEKGNQLYKTLMAAK